MNLPTIRVGKVSISVKPVPNVMKIAVAIRDFLGLKEYTCEKEIYSRLN